MLSKERQEALSKLVDLRDVVIDPKLTTEERMRSFVEQIKDPHHYRVGEVEVHVSYTEGGPSLTDCFLELKGLK